MTQEELTQIQETVDSEGFDYAFMYYSNFDDIDDEEFHALRMAYRVASKKLYDYLKMDSVELTDDIVVTAPVLKSW